MVFPIASITSVLTCESFRTSIIWLTELLRKSAGAMNWKNTKCSKATISAAKKYNIVPKRQA